ncbi:TetR/AcrR family transcriptional regulator [Glycomyces dulcitolivorans]|uniref:TetR/AcrR family transcriptional regulator n=1 Tax=Glycomyces dulcitolivorans TaxID=2200759 RepID=UPI000DD2CBFD|nr:TetR/AcrR family transcriptional regulator [Glycomyces dulcitolivorans]
MPVPKGAVLDPAQTRAAILDAATVLLYQRGLDGIGVAKLCAAIGISKETLYRHFGSKDGLVQDVLDARHDRLARSLDDAVDAGADPTDQLAAVFDVLARWHAEPDFRGCAILNAATQHHAGPARAVAARLLDHRLDLLTGIAARSGASDPARLGRQLLTLLTGATVLADHHGDADAAEHAKQAALALLRSAGPTATL